MLNRDRLAGVRRDEPGLVLLSQLRTPHHDDRHEWSDPMGVCRGIGRRGSAHGQDRDAVGAWSHHIRHHLCLLGHGDEEVNGSPTFRSSILAVFQFLHLRRSRPPDKHPFFHPSILPVFLSLHLQAELGSHRVGEGRLRQRNIPAGVHLRQSRPTIISNIRHHYCPVISQTIPTGYMVAQVKP